MPAASRLCPSGLHVEAVRHPDGRPSSFSCSGRRLSRHASVSKYGDRGPSSSPAFALLAKLDPLVSSALQRCPSAWLGSPVHAATVELCAIFTALVDLRSFVEPAGASPSILVRSSAAGFVGPPCLARGRACLRSWRASVLVPSARGHCVRSARPRSSGSWQRDRLAHQRWS